MSKNKITFITICMIVFAVVFVLVINVKKYIDEFPEIVPKSDNFMVECGETISIDELAEFENAKEYGFLTVEGNDTAKIKNKKTLTAGYCTGKLTVTMYAIGENHERTEQTVEVDVAIFD